MKAHHFTRREFLKTLRHRCGARVAHLRALDRLRRNAPSNRITMGLIGMGLMMGSHHHIMLGRDDVQVLAVCDVDRDKRERAKAQTEKAYGAKQASGTYKGCDAYNEYERVIEREDIDAVFVVTPDHWHAMISAGGHEERQGCLCAEADDADHSRGPAHERCGEAIRARSCRSARSSAPSAPSARPARSSATAGSARSTPFTRTWANSRRRRRCRRSPSPTGFDYDRWLGPTPWYPYNKKRVEGNYGGGWRCFWDYGSRKNGDWGAHHFDIIQWALGMDDSGPVEFIPKGYHGAEYQSHVYADGTKVWKNHPVKNGQMIQFIGDKGEVLVSRGDRLETTPADLKDRPLAPGDIHLYESYNHEGNWLECIKTPQAADLPGGDRPSHRDGLPPQRHCRAAQPPDQVGPGEGRDRWRRRRQPVAGSPAPHARM